MIEKGTKERKQQYTKSPTQNLKTTNQYKNQNIFFFFTMVVIINTIRKLSFHTTLNNTNKRRKTPLNANLHVYYCMYKKK